MLRTARNQNASARCGDMVCAGHGSLRMEIQEHGGEVTFLVRVAPRASRDAIEGKYQGALKVRLTAPPVDDCANEALRRLLAERLKAPLSAVRIVAGEKSRNKRVAIAGVSRARVLALLAEK